MKKSLLLILSGLCALMAPAQTELRNPIIPGYHPDPSVCRVGDDFYLVNSSFQYFPGVPIFHSKDLVNWTQIGNVLDRESQLPLKGASSWLGIYAPTIRYHEGTFYMITTNVGGGGNFLVTATDPRGPWSEPVWLKQEGYYYLLISEGGTELAHRLTIARSRDIYGPYEANPANPILTNCSMPGQSKQIQGTGHGDFVQATDGSWWLVFLAYRNFGGSYHHLGRETYLAPVEWPEGEWPVVNGGQPIDTVMTIPYAALHAQQTRQKGTTAPEWIYIQNPIADNYVRRDGRLTLISHGTLTDNDQPTFIGRRQEAARFVWEAELDAAKLGVGCTAGLTAYQIHDGHMDVTATKQADGAVTIAMRYRIKSLTGQTAAPRSIQTGKTVARAKGSNVVLRLRLSSDGDMYHFDYSADGGKSYQRLASHNCSLVSTEVVGGFTGVVLGMFAEGQGSADFTNFNYTEK